MSLLLQDPCLTFAFPLFPMTIVYVAQKKLIFVVKSWSKNQFPPQKPQKNPSIKLVGGRAKNLLHEN